MSLAKQGQKLVNSYREAGEPWPATALEIARWAVRNRKWFPQPSAVIDQCADQISRAMREEHITDPQGRVVRAKHVAKILRNGEQVSLWADIRSANREHMAIAFQQRRRQIVGDCRQLNTDIESYNENMSPVKPIQMSFDFTYDLEELKMASVS